MKRLIAVIDDTVQRNNPHTRYLLQGLMFMAVSSCCSWNFDPADFNFNAAELKHLGPYKRGDTAYFISNSGSTEAITITEITEENEKGSRCLLSVAPHHDRSIRVNHLPEDKWYGTTYYEGETKEINYQSLISVSKFPLKKTTGYTISFQGFVSSGNAFGKPGTVHLMSDAIIPDCYTITHSYPEKLKEPTDIERIYWTDEYGLTAYTNKKGDTWLIRELLSNSH